MAKWRAKAAVYVNSTLVRAGETFEADGPPGAKWQPLDDEATAIVAASKSLSGSAPQQPSVVQPPRGLLDIPADWQDLPAAKRIGLAKRLGAPPATKAADADRLIEAELARRATV